MFEPKILVFTGFLGGVFPCSLKRINVAKTILRYLYIITCKRRRNIINLLGYFITFNGDDLVPVLWWNNLINLNVENSPGEVWMHAFKVKKEASTLSIVNK